MCITGSPPSAGGIAQSKGNGTSEVEMENLNAHAVAASNLAYADAVTTLHGTIRRPLKILRPGTGGPALDATCQLSTTASSLTSG